MNLKDAFRAQNKLQALMDEAGDILQDRGNTLKVTTTHLRSRVMPEAQDAVVEESAPSEYAEHINQVAAFLMVLLAEREKLSAAIADAKSRQLCQIAKIDRIVHNYSLPAIKLLRKMSADPLSGPILPYTSPPLGARWTGRYRAWECPLFSL